MKTTVSQKIKIGMFTITGILLFLVGIFLIGSKKNMFGDTFMIYGTFKSVGGLEVGNNIRFAGINVGTVDDISIVSDTTIRVNMVMKEEVRPFLKADALASIGSDGLMGDKLITIASGSANEVRLLSKGSRIRTVNPVDFDRVITKFTNVADNAEVITRELASMAVQIRTGNGTISKLLYTDDLSKSLEATADNAKAITGSLAGIAAHIQSGRGSIGSLIYTDSLANALESAGSKADAAMTTIQEGAYGFSENMKALQGNYFLRGYFKRKAAKEADSKAADSAPAPDIDKDMDEEELETIITEAQKALDAKRKSK
jgi:ABC-type transport system involved in resistance to organic solvents, periplasmic component